VGLEDPPIRSPAKASKTSPLTEMSLSQMEESTNVSDLVVSCLVFPENVISSVLEIDQRLMNKYFTLRDAFRAFDQDKTGEITESKFLEGVIQMNTQISEDQIREVFKSIDLDGNGRITFDEFCHLA
jgi:Ca2+-binding EF-hand superfamily protein